MSGTELTVVRGGELAATAPSPGLAHLTPERLDLLKRTICQGATDDEFALFVARAERTGLDPFARQIYAVKRWDARLGREVMTIQVGIDGFRLIAERTGNYTPGREPTYEYDPQGNVYSATAYVRKYARGEWHETAAKAYWDEYSQTNKQGRLVGMWEKMPHNQLAKCAEALALRRAFPQELGGLYTPDEMGQADNPVNSGRGRAAEAIDVTADREKWEQVRAEIIKLVNSLSVIRKAHWVAEMQRQFGNRTMGHTTIEQLETFLADIKRADSPPADDIIDVAPCEVTAEGASAMVPPVAQAAPGTTPASATHEANSEPLGKQQLRVLIDRMKREYWLNPQMRDAHWSQFLQAHFGIADIANADQKTLQLVANALQAKLNARKRELEEDEADNPFRHIDPDSDPDDCPFDPDPVLSGGAA